MNKPALLLAAGALLALVQQQLLLQRPPRLLELHSSTASSGPAALSLRFSRPMDRASLAERSQLQPALPHQWLGANNPLRLLLAANQPITGAIQLLISGVDQRGLALRPQRWSWDPRPRLLAVVPKGSGEQLQLLQHDGRWGMDRPSPWPAAMLKVSGCGCCRWSRAPCSVAANRAAAR
jgi:hypothetical protein